MPWELKKPSSLRGSSTPEVGNYRHKRNETVKEEWDIIYKLPILLVDPW